MCIQGNFLHSALESWIMWKMNVCTSQQTGRAKYIYKHTCRDMSKYEGTIIPQDVYIKQDCRYREYIVGEYFH